MLKTFGWCRIKVIRGSFPLCGPAVDQMDTPRYEDALTQLVEVGDTQDWGSLQS